MRFFKILYLNNNFKRLTDSFAENKTIQLTDMFPFIMQILSDKFGNVEKVRVSAGQANAASNQTSTSSRPGLVVQCLSVQIFGTLKII